MKHSKFALVLILSWAGTILSSESANAKTCSLAGKALAADAAEWSDESVNFQNPVDVKPLAKGGLQKKVMEAIFSGESNRCKEGPGCIVCK